MYYVYILKSKIKHWHYVGSTADIVSRLKEHNVGKTKSTKLYRPFTVVYTETFSNSTEARKREIAIKKNHALKKELLQNMK